MPGVDVLRTKSIEQSLQDTEDPEFKLKRRLTALDLTVFGVGVIIGAGIFTLTGRVAQANAGPGVALSFVLAAVCCGLAALCYAEFASTVPVSGSAYTFSYATLGELVAWIIGWDLLLEMMLGASVVAQGWASYFETFLDQIGIAWPEGLGYGDTFNLPAFLLVLILTGLVAYGIKESLRVNLVLVAVKLFIVLFVIVAGIGFINADNYDPFIPPSVPAEGGGEWLHTPLLQLMTGSPGGVRRRRRPLRGVPGVLRLHRLRRRRDHRRGGRAPAERPAARHHRLAGDLHDPLRRGRAGDHRHGQLRGHQPRRGARAGVHRPGQGRLRDADLGRRGRRSDHRRDDAADRRRARDVRDEPRQPAPTQLRPRLAQDRDARCGSPWSSAWSSPSSRR